MEGVLLVASLAQRLCMRLVPGPSGGAASARDLAPKFEMNMAVERLDE
jgi:hypothetical protein